MTRRFLFLQGPLSPFFDRLGARLRADGHATFRINLCRGDTLFWTAPAADYTGTAAEWPGFIAAFLREHAITDLVLLGEQRPLHRAAIAAAHAAGVRVTVTDFGYLRPDWIVLEQDGMNRDSRLPREPGAILELAQGLPPVPRQKLYEDSFPRQALWDMRFHLANLDRRRFRYFERFLLHHPVATYLGTGAQLLLRWPNRARAALKLRAFPQATPLWLFAMQMETDYSIRAYSHFADMDQAIDECIAAFAAKAPPDAGLLVKMHPLDPGLKNWRRRIARLARAHGVPRRVHFLAGGDLDAMLRRCRGLVTVNSTVGIRALQLGRPVHAMGEAVYRVEGLAHLGPLDAFWSAPPPDPALAQAFLRAIAAHLHVRGTYYAEPGLTAAVDAAAERLGQGTAGIPQDIAARSCGDHGPQA